MSQDKEKGKLSAVLGMKCPACREGDLFETATFSFSKPFDMPERCPVCSQRYEPEPGFYYGAMFISYIFTGFFAVGFVALLHWVMGWGTMASFAALIAVMAIFFVYIFRLARSIWIHTVVKYDPSRKK